MILDKFSELIYATDKALGITDVSAPEHGRSGGVKRKCCLLGIEQAYGQMATAWQGGSGGHECGRRTYPRQHRAAHCAHFCARTYRNVCAVFGFGVVSMSVVKSKVIIVSSHIRSWSFRNSLSAISTMRVFYANPTLRCQLAGWTGRSQCSVSDPRTDQSTLQNIESMVRT